MDFRRKARYFTNGANIPNHKSSAYTGVVSRESKCIAFTLAALNGLNIMSADIQNDYLRAPISENTGQYVVQNSVQKYKGVNPT